MKCNHLVDLRMRLQKGVFPILRKLNAFSQKFFDGLLIRESDVPVKTMETQLAELISGVIIIRLHFHGRFPQFSYCFIANFP